MLISSDTSLKEQTNKSTSIEDLESEQVRDLLDEIVLARSSVNLNGVQAQPRRFLAKKIREHPITFEEIAQSPFGISGFGKKSPG